MDLTRGLPAAMIDALSGPVFPVLFAYLDWPGEVVRVHTGVGDISWGGFIWRGVGFLGDVQIPEEGAEIAATEALLTLAGVPADLNGYASDLIRNRTVELHIGLMQARPGGHDGKKTTGPGSTLISAPARLFSGVMDNLSLITSSAGDGVEHSAQVPVKTGQGARSGASIYHSDEDQKARFPGDTAGRHLILSYAKARKRIWENS